MTLDLDPYKDLIKQRCGLVLEGNGEDKLTTVLAQRIGVTKSGNSAEYFHRLQSSKDEFQDLVNLLTINETYFFRESEQLRLLTERLVPRLLRQRADGQPLRILSAGCSSGEEPYSIVMSLREKYGDDVSHLFSFSGGDIDTQALAKARSGRFSEFSFRGVGEHIKARYFEHDGWNYRLKDEIRERVEFHEMNLFAETFPAALHDFDIIFFRNVSIYFDTPTRRIIQKNLAALLKDQGYLVIGTAETLANDLGVLALVEEDGLFYFAKGQLPATAAVPRPAFDFERHVPAPAASPEPSWTWSDLSVYGSSAVHLPVVEQFSFDLARKYCEEKCHDEALEMLTRLLKHTPGDAHALLLQAHIQLNRKEFKRAEAGARQALQSDPWSIDAFVLLGLAAKWQELSEEAVRWFKQAVYARHECWPARYYLADLYRAGGEADKAQREYRGVLQLLSLPMVPDHGIKVLPLGLPHAELRFLCEHQLGKLGGTPQRLAGRK
ncbi:MAG: CheR family methyltransferase [Sulfurimicrobium sp.]|nr:CheR family methyltransferase [Sulfurimicrobium sp.]